MPTYQTNGIIIGRTNFGEADRVIRFLTPDRGKVSAVAKGVRKIKSRAAGHLEPLGEATLTLATGRNLDIITSARLLWYPHQLIADYARLSLALVMATAVDRLTEPDHHPGPALYQLLAEALRSLDAGAVGPLPELWFKLRLLEVLGYHPELSVCVVCGRHSDDLAYAFNPALGGITCEADTEPGSYPMNPSTIKLWRLLSVQPFAVSERIQQAPALAAASLAACDAFYEHHLGRAFRPNEDKKH